MKCQNLLLGLSVAAGTALADEKKDQPTPVKHDSPWLPVNTPKWMTTIPADKLERLDKDMHSLASSARQHKLFTSMTAVMATAVPETFRQALATNPESVHRQFRTATPDWYKAIPTDVRKFMEDNKRAAKSIFAKDVGPLPTDAKAHATRPAEHRPKETGKAGKDGKDGGKVGEKSEAGSLSMVGATSVALLGTFAFALLLL